MKGTQANAVLITCKLSNLCVFTTDPDAEYPETILNQDEPFSLRVTVEFSGTGALALIPLCLSIQVNFFAEPCGFGSKVELGHTSVDTSAKLFTYTPTLTVATPATVGLVSEAIYQITGVLRRRTKFTSFNHRFH